jgi:hypothetical protein
MRYLYSISLGKQLVTVETMVLFSQAHQGCYVRQKRAWEFSIVWGQEEEISVKCPQPWDESLLKASPSASASSEVQSWGNNRASYCQPNLSLITALRLSCAPHSIQYGSRFQRFLSCWTPQEKDPSDKRFGRNATVKQSLTFWLQHIDTFFFNSGGYKTWYHGREEYLHVIGVTVGVWCVPCAIQTSMSE